MLKTIRLIIKRIIDIALSLFILTIISPLLILCAAAVFIESGRPIFYLQERIGKKGKPFVIYKFRTMIQNAEKKGLGYELVEGDERITKTGDFLRRWSIDEFPQLLNVLKGDMSLVGPRPTLGYQVEQYDSFQKRRLDMKPGMTGLATIRGRNLISWNERIEYDVWYIDNHSILLDFKIMWETFSVIFKGSGIYAKTTEVFKIKPSGKNTSSQGEPNNFTADNKSGQED